MFYNVENLFDTIDDPRTNDNDFLPTSSKQWNTIKYNYKLQQLAKVFTSIKKDVNFSWDIGVPPNNGGKYYIPNFCSGMAIPVVARDKEISWEILKFYASKTFADKCMFVVLKRRFYF